MTALICGDKNLPIVSYDNIEMCSDCILQTQFS